MSGNDAVIIKKKKVVGGHGHHGGAWKVAYADFVTAMMAFFLMLWLISTTTPEQKRGIAEYFAPAAISKSNSGAGGFGGGTAFVDDGSRYAGSNAVVQDVATTAQKQLQSRQSSDEKGGSPNEDQVPKQKDLSEEEINKILAEREAALFEQAEMSLRQAMQDMPELAELSKHLIIDQTPEGMRIQLVDQEGRPMFPPFGAEPLERTKLLLAQIAKVIDRLPNRIKISGHTDQAPYTAADGATNWELSSARANASRRVLQQSGVETDRIYSVDGRAGSEPLYPDDPYAPANRRISIVLLREAPVLPPNHKL